MTVDSHITRWIVSHNFRKLRREKNYTQSKFADELNITRSAVGSYEEHRADVPLYIIINICKIFQLDIGDFVTKKL